jgi:HEAT repeat protein
MPKIFAVIVAASLMSSDGSPDKPLIASSAFDNRPASMDSETAAASADIPALISAARGAPTLICALASQAVRGFGDWSDAPVTPLAVKREVATIDTRNITSNDTDLLLRSLDSDDPCVRELSIRLVTRHGGRPVTNELLSRLTASSAQLREVAAFGLGLQEPAEAIDPLIRALRDGTAGVRANSAWALGRIEHGKSLSPLMSVLDDREEVVREAATIAVGHLDSTRAAPALMRLLQRDDSPRVRRAAAWALGEMESPEGVDVLAAALTRDSDARVREMSAWALGNIESSGGTAALLAAAQRDADDKVRETAVWALAEIEDATSADALAAIAARDRSSRVRGTAAWAIGNIRDGSRRAPAALVGLLKDESEDTRLKAAWALSEIEDPSTAGAIQQALRTEKSERVNKGLIRALMKTGGRSVATLTELLDSKDPEVREAAVRALAGRSGSNPWPWPQPRPRPNP